MKLQGTDKYIIQQILIRHPEAGDALERARARVNKTKREIEPFQALVLYALARPYNFTGARILEIGTAYGFSAAVLAEACPLAQIVTLNPQAHEVEAARENLKDYNNVAVYQAKSWDWLKEYNSKPLDMIFVDGDHRRVKADLPFWELLAPGGLMLFHDYSPAGSRRECPPVYEAVNEWTAELGRALDVVVMDEGNVGMAGLYKALAFETRPNAEALAICKQYSLNSYPHLSHLYSLAQKTDALGALVECGVSRGGSTAALYMGGAAAGHERPVWLFDTFEGMPAPGKGDEPGIHDRWKMRNQGRDWCKGSQAEVDELFMNLDVKPELHYFQGDFANTFHRANLVGEVAVLHVDATLYDSTLMALINFIPLMAEDALVVVSAYHYWSGIKAAVGAYFKAMKQRPPEIKTFDGQHVYWRVSRE